MIFMVNSRYGFVMQTVMKKNGIILAVMNFITMYRN